MFSKAAPSNDGSKRNSLPNLPFYLNCLLLLSIVAKTDFGGLMKLSLLSDFYLNIKLFRLNWFIKVLLVPTRIVKNFFRKAC